MFRRMRQLIASRAIADAAVWTGGEGACVTLIDRDGRIVSVSDGVAALTGRPDGALAGERFASLFSPADQDALERALAAGDGAVAVMGHTGVNGSGQRLDLTIRRRPDGRCAVLMVAAASPRREDLEAELAAARAEAREAADRLADLSHEMRTPLNAVIGFAGAMSAEMFGPLGHQKYYEYAEHIRASGGHLLDLVNTILDLARIEADRFALKREAVDVGALALECAGMVRLAAESAGLKLTARVADDLPQSWLDPRAVRQILLNLLSNAVKFTSDGEIAIAVERQGDAVVATVSDTGVGMSEAELEKLGARFTAAQGAGVRGAKGAGLGLALAFALAELHGGSLEITSAPGEGVVARLVLPIEAKPSRAPRLQAIEAGAAARPAPPPAVLTQLDRIEAYRRERASAA